MNCESSLPLGKCHRTEILWGQFTGGWYVLPSAVLCSPTPSAPWHFHSCPVWPLWPVCFSTTCWASVQFPVGFSWGGLAPHSLSPFLLLQPGWAWASPLGGLLDILIAQTNNEQSSLSCWLLTLAPQPAFLGRLASTQPKRLGLPWTAAVAVRGKGLQDHPECWKWQAGPGLTPQDVGTHLDWEGRWQLAHDRTSAALSIDMGSCINLRVFHKRYQSVMNLHFAHVYLLFFRHTSWYSLLLSVLTSGFPACL